MEELTEFVVFRRDFGELPNFFKSFILAPSSTIGRQYLFDLVGMQSETQTGMFGLEKAAVNNDSLCDDGQFTSAARCSNGHTRHAPDDGTMRQTPKLGLSCDATNSREPKHNPHPGRAEPFESLSRARM